MPHFKDYYAYTTLYEHWIAKFGLPEIFVTDNGTQFINNDIITLSQFYKIKQNPRTSHAPRTKGLVEGMNRSIQEYLGCIINVNDTKYTEWPTDLRLLQLAYNSQITTTLGLSPYCFRGFQSKTTEANIFHSQILKKRTKKLSTYKRFNLLQFITSYNHKF